MNEMFNDPWVTGRIDALKAINAALQARVTHLESLLRGLPEWASNALEYPWMVDALRRHIDAGMGEVSGG